MMDKLALEMETFEEILERFEVDVAQAKQCGDYSQMVSKALGSVFWRRIIVVVAAVNEEGHTRRQQICSELVRISNKTIFVLVLP